MVVNAADTAKFDAVPGDYTRIAVGRAPAGLARLRRRRAGRRHPARTPGHAPDDPLLLYFTSGTTSRPKLVEHTQVSYPVGHLATDVLDRPAARRRAPEHLLAGLGQARVEQLLRARGSPRRPSSSTTTRASTPPALLERIRRDRITTFCAPPTVWRMLIQADLTGGPGPLREVVAAGEPLNPEVIEQVRARGG